MKSRIISIAKNPLISGSSVVLAGSLMANIIHYLFNLVMGRVLTPAEYGLVVSLVSLTSLFMIFQVSFASAFAKFSARFKATGDKGGLSDLIKKGFRLNFIFAFGLLVVMLFSSPFVMQLLHVQNFSFVLLIYLYIFVSILSALPTGILQGELRVILYSFLSILSALLKIAIGVSLVLLGFSVFGAIFGIFLSVFIPYLLGLFLIRKEVIKKSSDIDEQELLVKELKEYGSKFFLASLGITLFSSIDIILARHFFDPTLAGQYAALAIMGKAIFYLTFPINFIFFPLIAQKREKKESVLEILLLGAFITTIVSVSASFIYFLFPGLVLNIFFPAEAYKILAPYLGPFSLYILIFAVASLLNTYLLSIGKTQIYKINIFCGILLTCLIIVFHASLFQVIGMLFFASLLLLILLLIYYWNNGRD